MNRSKMDTPQSFARQLWDFVLMLHVAERCAATILVQMPNSSKQFCAVCGMPRLDPDPTGATCGNPSCLASVVEGPIEGFDSLQRSICKVGSDHGIEDPGPDEVLSAIDEYLDEFDKTEGKLNELAVLLELEVGAFNLNQPEMVDKISEKVKALQVAAKSGPTAEAKK